MRKDMKWRSKRELCNRAQQENSQVESAEGGEDAGDNAGSERVQDVLLDTMQGLNVNYVVPQKHPFLVEHPNVHIL